MFDYYDYIDRHDCGAIAGGGRLLVRSFTIAVSCVRACNAHVIDLLVQLRRLDVSIVAWPTS